MPVVFLFDGSVIGDIFTRTGHKNTDALCMDFHCKKIDNLSCCDRQHGTSDYRKNAEKLSSALFNLSEKAPGNFYEAVLTIYVCFGMNPDSFGTLDRCLSDFYFRDMSDGTLTREEAKAYLQELFLMVQACMPKNSKYFARGGQFHFCIGGRDEHGRDCFNAVSRLILESLTELNIHIPEVTLRWTNDTSKEVFRYALECERKDKNKRIAFTNDDRRIEAFTKICGFPYKEAVHYTLVGCNEPAMLGGMCASTSHANLAHSIEYVLHCRSEEAADAKSFESFFEIFRDQLYKDLDVIYHYDDLYNLQKAKDTNYVSCLFLNGCIENGKSITQGDASYGVSNIMFLGNVTVIDSLAVIKQFVFDEKSVTMRKLIDALKNNWAGYERLKLRIAKQGKFFGNDEETSNYAAKILYDALFDYIKDKKTVLGYPILIGDHTGYQLHFKWFGEGARATPDGRCDGEPLSYGISQNNGKLKNGLTALMNSISAFDVNGISSATVTNFSLDKLYAEDDRYFEKTVDMLMTYFKNGGTVIMK